MSPRNHPDWDPMPSPVVPLDQNVVAVDAAEHPLEERLSLDGLAHDQLRAAAREAPIVVRMTEWAIEARRRDFQGIRNRHEILDVEHRAQIATHACAIV